MPLYDEPAACDALQCKVATENLVTTTLTR